MRCINSINNKAHISIRLVIGYAEVWMLKLLVYMYLLWLVHGRNRLWLMNRLFMWTHRQHHVVPSISFTSKHWRIHQSDIRFRRESGGYSINKSRANTNRFITSCRELRRGKSDWFALWRDDHGIDDETWVEGVKRGNFRLHPGTVSEGCITITNNSDFAMIRNALMNTSLVQVSCMRSLMARGWVEVVASGSNNACP